LRRNLWLAGNNVRDFFISDTPAQAEIFRSQVAQMRKEDDQALNYLAQAMPGSGLVPKLRKSMGDFWSIVEPVPDRMLDIPNAGQFEFLQRVIVPRRGELYNALLDLSAADQQQLQESEKEFADARRTAARNLMVMLGISVLLSFIVARFSLRHADNLEDRAERHLAEVERARRELQQLSARLLEVEEEGRRRLSRELHDEIGQTLALLQIEISHAQALLGGSSPHGSGPLRDRLQRARELAERTVQTTRHISLLLRPALLDDLGLVPALQFQLEEFLRRSGIQCEFLDEGVADQLPDIVKTCVYRVVQEALHNCEKHSAASKVRVAVRQVPGFLVAEIEDDGRGFQLNSQGMPLKSTGLGLMGIRERAASARGALVIDSSPGRGTRIALRIPLEPGPVPDQTANKEVAA